MGFLTPFYALAALAIAGPIVFHLIRRQPRGEATFSSLMFLKPSPPRLTRRSRIDDWLLLLLRALVLLLLAIGFARPFFRQLVTSSGDLVSRRVVVAIDTSASMQRPEVWQAAMASAQDTIDSLGPNDFLCLYTLDQSAHALLPISDTGTSPGDSHAKGAAELELLEPTWMAGNMAEGLRSIADELVSASLSGADAPTAIDSIVLISDMHQGCGVDKLQGYDWPERVVLDIRQIRNVTVDNASLDVLPPSEDSPEIVRVLLENHLESESSVFDVAFATESGRRIANTQVQLPAGRTRVLSLGAAAVDAVKVVLIGDDWDADNAHGIVTRRKLEEQVLFLSSSKETEPSRRLDYFLSNAPLGSASLTRTVRTVSPEETSPQELALLLSNGTASVFVESDVFAEVDSEAYEAILVDFLGKGGNVIVCLAGASADHSTSQRMVRSMSGDDSVVIDEQPVEEFALIESVDYTHSVFEPFADSRFNDFSKIRVWKHRSVQWGSEGNGAGSFRTIASLDGGLPLIAVKTFPAEQASLAGRLWLITTGWQLEASSLALSSKFVPIIQGMLNRPDATRPLQAIEAGVPLTLPLESEIEYLGSFSGESHSIDANSEQVRLLLPGRYHITTPADDWEVVATVPRRERTHAPSDSDTVEAYGVNTGEVASAEDMLADAEQLKTEQLESRQRVWQWLIAAGVAFLVIESLLTLRSQPTRAAAT